MVAFQVVNVMEKSMGIATTTTTLLLIHNTNRCNNDPNGRGYVGRGFDCCAESSSCIIRGWKEAMAGMEMEGYRHREEDNGVNENGEQKKDGEKSE